MWAGPAVSRLIVTTTLTQRFPDSSGNLFHKEMIYYTNLAYEMRSYIAAHRAEFIPGDSTAGDPQDATAVMCLTNEGVMTIPARHTPQYTASIMHQHLIQHGCTDLNSSIEPLGFSSSAIAEGGFGDVWTGRLRNNQMKVAVKMLRFASLTGEAAEKELKVSL
ncbi:unnamed protein product [Rhizoctonia solani]|uniref:Protein kinase domain-containing protein n=1 Tax=Rhizoctonia solani TaxID=456999 RepID=A0A8H3A7U6_9AGAM|nr:unnamed protein product [Rhizoctonia solani]